MELVAHLNTGTSFVLAHSLLSLSFKLERRILTQFLGEMSEIRKKLKKIKQTY